MQAMPQKEPHRLGPAVDLRLQGERRAPGHEQVALPEIVKEAELLIVPLRAVVARVGLDEVRPPHFGQPVHHLLLVADIVLPGVHRQAVVREAVDAAAADVDEQVQQGLRERGAELAQAMYHRGLVPLEHLLTHPQNVGVPVGIDGDVVPHRRDVRPARSRCPRSCSRRK